MNGELTQQVLERVIVPYTKGRPAALIMDDYKAHWVQKVTDYAAANKIHLIKVPAGETPRLQPLDRSVIGPTKRVASSEWRKAVHANPERKLTLDDAINHFSVSFARITRTCIISGFNQSLDRHCSRVHPDGRVPEFPPPTPATSEPIQPPHEPSTNSGFFPHALHAPFFFGTSVVLFGG
jgi:hypothetical protein